MASQEYEACLKACEEALNTLEHKKFYLNVLADKAPQSERLAIRMAHGHILKSIIDVERAIEALTKLKDII